MTGHYHGGSRWSSSVIWSTPIHYSSRSGRQTLGFSFQRHPHPHLFSWARGDAMQYSGVNHQGVETNCGVWVNRNGNQASVDQIICTPHPLPKKKLQIWKTNTKCGNITYWGPGAADWCPPMLCCWKIKKPGHRCVEKTPCGDIMWVAGRTGKLPQIITSEINLMCGIQSVVIGTAAALDWSSKCYLLIHGMRTDTQSQRIDCAISSLCAVLTQWKREMRFNVVMHGSL